MSFYTFRKLFVYLNLILSLVYFVGFFFLARPGTSTNPEPLNLREVGMNIAPLLISIVLMMILFLEKNTEKDKRNFQIAFIFVVLLNIIVYWGPLGALFLAIIYK